MLKDTMHRAPPKRKDSPEVEELERLAVLEEEALWIGRQVAYHRTALDRLMVELDALGAGQ